MIFKVQVLDGKGFGQEAQTLVCCASFAGAAKTTQASVAAQEHLWNSTLTWSVSREELRSATSNTNHCKISVLRKDGTCLGWTVISLRSAKLQGQYKSDPQGLWLQLNATKLAEPPQLRVAYSLEDERRLPAPQQHRNRSPLILQHSDSSSSLASKASSGSLTSSSSGGPAEHSGWEAELGATAAAADGGRRQSAASEAQARKDRRSSAASLRPSRASSGSASRRMSAAAAADAAAATGEDAAVGHAAAGESSSGVLAAEGTQELAAATATEAPSDQQQPEATNSLHAEAAVSAGMLQEAAAAAEGSTAAAAAAQPVTFGEEALAAGEAGLPSFAEQRRQQQEQQQLQTEVQPPPQQQQQEHLVSAQPVETAQLALESSQPQAPAQDLAGQGQPAAALSAAADVQAVLAAAGLATGTGVAPQQVLLPPLATSGLPAAEAAPQPATPDAAATAGGQQVPPLAAAQMEAAPEHSLPAPDPVREFVLTLDVRSFQAGRRLPVALASIYVTAWLPQELVGFLVNGCGAKLPPRMTPLKTKPAVDIPRGSEGALPSGTASVSFACGVMALAGQLAAEPRVTLEVWHKERLRSDLLLGVSSLPLSALLQECWVDGYAPVYALMSKASVAAGSSRPPQQQQVQGEEEKVQVGLLRVVMSLEEKGPAQPAAATPAASSPKTTPSKRRQQQQQVDVSRAPASAAAAVDTQQGADQARQQQQQHVGPQSAAAAAAAAADPDAAGLGAQGFRQMPEYLVAWELEVWRKAEEARFRAQLQELEQQRMGVIEAAWRAREAQRQSEISAMRSKYTALEKETRELLSATQERERVLLAAEAELRLRKAGLEREAAARMTEAEVAVRRLQVECEHQLGIERERTAAALKQRDAAEARTAALEAQFTEYVASQRAAPEAQLKGELAEAQQAVKAAEAKLAAAVKLKQKYKQQVQQLAREVAALHHKQQQDLLEQQQQQLAAALAREQDSSAAAKRAELAALRQELGTLKAAALAANAAAFGAPWGGMSHRPPGGAVAGVPGSPTCSSSSAGSSYRHAAERRRAQHKQGRSRHGKENLQWQADDQLPAQQRSQHVAGRHHHHQHRQQQQEHGCAPGDLASDSGSSSRDGDSSGSGSDSSTGMLRLAAERSARETAAEVATIAAMLNPARGDNSSSSSAARLDTGLGGQQAAAEPSSAAAVAGSSSSGSSPMAEVRRLLKEKAELLATGLYGREDAVIGQIDARVQALAELAAAG